MVFLTIRKMFLDEKSSARHYQVSRTAFGLCRGAVEIRGDGGKMCGHGVTQSSGFVQSAATNEIGDVLLHNRIIIDIGVSDLRTTFIGTQMFADARSLMQDFVGQD